MNKVKVFTVYHPHEIEPKIEIFLNNNRNIEVISINGNVVPPDPISGIQHEHMFITYLLYKENELNKPIEATQVINKPYQINS